MKTRRWNGAAYRAAAAGLGEMLYPTGFDHSGAIARRDIDIREKQRRPVAGPDQRRRRAAGSLLA